MILLNAKTVFFMKGFFDVSGFVNSVIGIVGILFIFLLFAFMAIDLVERKATQLSVKIILRTCRE